MLISKEVTAMEVEIRLSEQCPSPKIVIVTSHMTEELEALVRLLQQDQLRSIPGFQGSHIVPLEPRDILRLCASRGKVLAVLAGGGEYVVKARLYELEEQLASQRFVRISNSELINLRQVKGFDLNLAGTIRVTLSDGQVTYVSRRYVNRIKKTLGI